MDNMNRHSAQHYLSPVNSQNIRSARTSPELGSQELWRRQQQSTQYMRSHEQHQIGLAENLNINPQITSLPSPPQHHEQPSFLNPNCSTSGNHHQQSIQRPLSPPSSDGNMSPSESSHPAFGHPMWMPDPSYDMTRCAMEDMIPNSQPQSTMLALRQSGYVEDTSGYQVQDASYQQTAPPASPPSNPLRSRRSSSKKYASSSSSFYTTPKKVRKRRGATTDSEVQFQCGQCPQTFLRHWNYKTHMQIHDPHRARDNICQHPSKENPRATCGKAFVRKTDLERHENCVHLRMKKFVCRACKNRFGRKDTLRRHEEDGCSKRPSIASKNNRNGSNSNFVCNSQALSRYAAAAAAAPVYDYRALETQAAPTPFPQHQMMGQVGPSNQQQMVGQTGPSNYVPYADQSGLPPIADMVQRVCSCGNAGTDDCFCAGTFWQERRRR